MYITKRNTKTCLDTLKQHVKENAMHLALYEKARVYFGVEPIIFLTKKGMDCKVY